MFEPQTKVAESLWGDFESGTIEIRRSGRPEAFERNPAKW